MNSDDAISLIIDDLFLKLDSKDKDSYYKECPIGGDTLLVIRVSNHRTYLQTWADRYKPTMIPSNKILRRMGRNLPIIYRKKLFYSFVFEDEKDTVGNTEVNGNWKITVNEVVNKAFDFSMDRLNLYIKALSNLRNNVYDEKILGKCTPVSNNINENRILQLTQIRLTESQLKQVIRESVTRILQENYGLLSEDHAQQRLPFRDDNGNMDDEYATKNNAEEFMDWIEEFGKIGTLGQSSITFEQGIESGLKTALVWFKGNEYKFWKNLSTNGFYDRNTRKTKCRFNSNGNIYVERMLELNGLIDSIYGNDFDYYVDKYQDNVGGCWAWKQGKGYAYCGSGGFSVVMKGWIRLDDIDWVETVYLNAYDYAREYEIRVKPNAKVEVFSITSPNDNYTFPLRGKHYIVSSTYFGNNSAYDEHGYAEVYDAQSKDTKYRDRKGNIMSYKERMKREALENFDENKIEYKFELRSNNGVIELYSYKIDGESRLLLDKNKKPFVNYIFSTIVGTKWGGLAAFRDDGKTNILRSNGEWIFNEWFERSSYDDHNKYFKFFLDGKVRIMTENEKVVPNKWVDDVNKIYDNDFYIIKDNRKYNLFTENGKYLFDKWANDIRSYPNYYEVKYNGAIYHIDKDGNKIEK